jgi:hypothetical protein
MIGKQYRLGTDALFHHDHQQHCCRRRPDGLRDAQDLVLQEQTNNKRFIK